jgi:hypothetical protein
MKMLRTKFQNVDLFLNTERDEEDEDGEEENKNDDEDSSSTKKRKKKMKGHPKVVRNQKS